MYTGHTYNKLNNWRVKAGDRGWKIYGKEIEPGIIFQAGKKLRIMSTIGNHSNSDSKETIF